MELVRFLPSYSLPGTPAPASVTTTTLTDTAKTAVTGTQIDDKFAAQLIGKDIPIFVGGQALMGSRIGEGPFITTVDGAGFCDMIVFCAVAATPTATRQLQYINLNGTKSFESSDGGATWTPLGTVFSGVEITSIYGTEEQTPLASSIARYGSRAVPYRSHIGVELKNIPLAEFANEIPFVSIFVYESDYVTRSDALLKLANYSRFDSSECEIEVSGHDPFWVVIQQSTYIEYIQALQKTIGRNWNVVTSDKLYIFENTSTETPITITRADIIEDTIGFVEADPLSIPVVRSMGFIDTERDNDFNSVRARRARFPVPLTASESPEEFDIPIGMVASDATAAVNRSLLTDDIARTKFSCKLMPHMRGIEPGDLIFPDVDDEIDFPIGRVISAARNAEDWTTDIVAELVELPRLASAPEITSDGGSTTASISIAENTTAVTTVAATDADDDVVTFLISGGVDAALFTIDATTGELSFINPPDYEFPIDADLDNIYEVIVRASDGELSDTQAISITVTNVADGGGTGSPIGLLLSLTYTLPVVPGSPMGLTLPFTHP